MFIYPYCIYRYAYIIIHICTSRFGDGSKIRCLMDPQNWLCSVFPFQVFGADNFEPYPFGVFHSHTGICPKKWSLFKEKSGLSNKESGVSDHFLDEANGGAPKKCDDVVSFFPRLELLNLIADLAWDRFTASQGTKSTTIWL